MSFPVNLSMKIDWDMRQRLDKIALYEKKKRSTLARDIILDKIQVYERNPAFKRFVIQLERQKQDKEKSR